MKNQPYNEQNLTKLLGKGYSVQSDDEKITVLVRTRKVGIFWNLVLTFITGGWWLIFWIYRAVTKYSVVRLYKDSGDIPAVEPNPFLTFVRRISGQVQALNSGKKMGLAAVIAGMVVVGLIAAGVSNVNQKNDASNLAYATWSKNIEKPISEASCLDLQKVITSGPTITKAIKLRSKAMSAAKGVSVWSASTYISKNSWVNDSRDLSQEFQAELRNLIDPILRINVEGTHREGAVSGLNQRKALWQAAFLDFAISDCKLSDALSKSENIVSQVQTSAISIQTAASNRPWYPKGYEEISGYPDYAYKNGGASCSYSFGSCATFRIVAKYGCAGTLYVETNSLENGVIVDWGNDTVRALAPGQIAAMETTFSNDAGGNWTFTELNCY